MSTRVLTIVVVLLALSIGLAATNPTMGDYRGFVEGELSRNIERIYPVEGDKLDQDKQMLRSQAQQLVTSLLASATVRRNCGLFSLFETKLLGIDLVVLGIGSKFVPIRGFDRLNEKIHRILPASRL